AAAGLHLLEYLGVAEDRRAPPEFAGGHIGDEQDEKQQEHHAVQPGEGPQHAEGDQHQSGGGEQRDARQQEVHQHRREDRGEGEHYPYHRNGRAEDGPEGDIAEVLDVQRDAESEVVELYSGEDDREQEYGDAQAGRRADEKDDQSLRTVDQQRRSHN